MEVLTFQSFQHFSNILIMLHKLLILMFLLQFLLHRFLVRLTGLLMRTRVAIYSRAIVRLGHLRHSALQHNHGAVVVGLDTKAL